MVRYDSLTRCAKALSLQHEFLQIQSSIKNVLDFYAVITVIFSNHKNIILSFQTFQFPNSPIPNLLMINVYPIQSHSILHWEFCPLYRDLSKTLFWTESRQKSFLFVFIFLLAENAIIIIRLFSLFFNEGRKIVLD